MNINEIIANNANYKDKGGTFIMLRIFLLSLFWGICATCLVRPWFWEGVKNKNLFNDGNTIGFDKYFWRTNIAVEIAFFLLIFASSFLSYIMLGARQSIYGSFVIIGFCFYAQTVWAHQNKIFNTLMYLFTILCLVLAIQDAYVSSRFTAPLNRVSSVPLTTTSISEETNTKNFISADELQNLYKASSISGPTYNNNKYIYIANSVDNGYGIILIDRTNPSVATFINCNYKFDILTLREKYPDAMLRKLFIAISNDNVPYGVYAKADKSWLFGSYAITNYILLNLFTGEIMEYAEADLPDFLKNNSYQIEN